MTKLGSRKLDIYPKVTKMGSIIGHRIDHNGVGGGQRHISGKNLAKSPPPRDYLHESIYTSDQVKNVHAFAGPV